MNEWQEKGNYTAIRRALAKTRERTERVSRIAEGEVEMFCFRCGKKSVVKFAKRYNTEQGKIGTNIGTELCESIRGTNEGVSLVSVAEVGEMNGMKK